MPNRVPRTYDEIARATVPDPDSSWRPSDHQEKLAYTGFRALSPEEQKLHERVERTLDRSGGALDHVEIEVENDCVILRGQVKSAAAIRRVVELVENVPGVRQVVDRLVIAAE